MNSTLGLLLWEGGFFIIIIKAFLIMGGIFRHLLQKYVIKCLIMLCIFVFTMGQLLSVHDYTGSGERTSAEWFKYWPK